MSYSHDDLEISAAEARRVREHTAPIIDVREQHECDQLAVDGAVSVPLSLGVAHVVEELSKFDHEGVVICAAGVRSLHVVEHACAAGLVGWKSVIGGVESWHASGGAVRSSKDGLSADDRIRYERQIRLPLVGESGQLRLRDARVLIVGVGGLGCPASMQLAAAGVGTIGIVDADVVSLSNLHRQLLYQHADCGRAKVDVARERLEALSHDLRVEVCNERLDASNVDPLLGAGWDAVVDCTDDPQVRPLLAEYAVRHCIPLVHGSVYRNEGRVIVFHPSGKPCWNCVFPEIPHGALAPNCTDAGVLGVVPGIIGMLQAAETLKLLLDAPESSFGSMLIYSMDDMAFEQITLRPREGCPTCDAGRSSGARDSHSRDEVPSSV
jgi:molybdopterin/thiamine biosynthesis adenylyltransferase/rhodanese-related sulfurtransferase